MRRQLVRFLSVILALLFLLEAWLWDHLEPVVARVVNIVPWGRVKVRLRRLIDNLPPYAALTIFIIPIIVVLLPLKFLEVYVIATQGWLGVILVLVFAKFLGVGVAAFIFDVTRPKLLEMAWFEKLYQFVLALRAKAAALVEPVKRRIVEIMRGDGDGWSSRMLRLIQRFRKSVHEAR